MLMLALVIFFVAGCKIAVIVVEGGEVQSGASGTCGAGTICINQVNDTNYTETFTAVADPGWKFVRWNKADGSLCADRTDPSCTVSTAIFEGKTGFEAIIASAQTFYLMPVFRRSGAPITDTIIVDDREWAQPDLFFDISWNEINAVCPAGNCIDGGVLNGYDVTGMTWASTDDMNALLNNYIQPPSALLGPGPDSTYGSNSNFWGDDAFDAGWRVNSTLGQILRGWTSSAAAVSSEGTVASIGWVAAPHGDTPSSAITNQTVDADEKVEIPPWDPDDPGNLVFAWGLGAWLYRD
jgi:hypothetical protein